MWPAIAEPVSALKVVIHMCSAAATVDLTYMWIIMHSPENSYKVYNANGTPQKTRGGRKRAPLGGFEPRSTLYNVLERCSIN